MTNQTIKFITILSFNRYEPNKDSIGVEPNLYLTNCLYQCWITKNPNKLSEWLNMKVNTDLSESTQHFLPVGSWLGQWHLASLSSGTDSSPLRAINRKFQKPCWSVVNMATGWLPGNTSTAARNVPQYLSGFISLHTHFMKGMYWSKNFTL